MGEQRRIKRERARHGLPDQLLHPQALLHRRDGDVAERVVEEMQRHIGEEDEPAGEADLTDARRREAQGARREAVSGVAEVILGRISEELHGAPPGPGRRGSAAAHRIARNCAGRFGRAWGACRAPVSAACSASPYWRARVSRAKTQRIRVGGGTPPPREFGASRSQIGGERRSRALPEAAARGRGARSAAVQPTQRLCRRRDRPDSARRLERRRRTAPKRGTAPEGPGADAYKVGWAFFHVESVRWALASRPSSATRWPICVVCRTRSRSPFWPTARRCAGASASGSMMCWRRRAAGSPIGSPSRPTAPNSATASSISAPTRWRGSSAPAASSRATGSACCSIAARRPMSRSTPS